MLFKPTPADAIQCAIYLSGEGLQKKVMANWFGSLANTPAVTSVNSQSCRYIHRDSQGWLSKMDNNGAVAGDRAYRLLLRIFETHPEMRRRSYDAYTLVLLNESFKTLFPCTEMSATRLHFFIQNMRFHNVISHPSCEKCQLPYVTSSDHSRLSCSLCYIYEREIKSLFSSGTKHSACG